MKTKPQMNTDGHRLGMTTPAGKACHPSRGGESLPKLRFPEFRNTGAWEVTTLGGIATITMGISPKSSHYNSQSIGLPLLQGNADIKNRSSFPRIYTSEITKECFPEDILMSVRAPVGKISQSYHHACIGRGIAAIHSNETNIQKFIYQFLLWFESRWKSFSQGSTFESVNSKDVKELIIDIPSPPEQQKIADCLSSIDELITVHAQKLDTLKAHKKGLMQQLFPAEGETVPKLRFPEFRNTGAWEEKPLGKVAKIITGNTPKTAESNNYGGDRLFVSPADISDQRYISTTKTTLSDQGFEKTRPIKANSILFVCIGSTIGKVGQNKFECATNQQINSVVPLNKYSNDFIYSFLEKNSGQIAIMAGKQAVPIINKTLFSSVIISYPSPPEQQKIADCFSSIDELIAAQAQKLDTLKAHKKGLMQQLFPSTDEVNA